MKVKALEVKGEMNTGVMTHKSGTQTERKDNKIISKPVEFDWIEIKQGRYIKDGISHPLRVGDKRFYKRMFCLEHEGRKVYWLNSFGKDEGKGCHVSFSKLEYHRFLWKQSDHWLQKENNIRYIINIIFLVIGVYIGLKQM